MSTFGIRRSLLVVVVLALASSAALIVGRAAIARDAKDDEVGGAAGDGGDAVSALGRIEPEHGIIRIGVPSTPPAILGSVVRTLLVETGDDVTEGQLLAETDSAPLERAAVDLATAELAL